tara:strand:+ start:18738 stop:19904 length:1167 start_codon:yes stop_codon:yes gene_type:complete
MITINVMGDSINGSANNEQFGVPYTQEKHEAMVLLQEASNEAATPAEYQEIVADFQKLLVVNYKETVEGICPNIHINNATGEHYLKVGDKVSSIPMPEALVDRIKDSLDKSIDFEPLMKMWTRWLRNPILREKTSQGAGKRFSEKMFNYINADFTNYTIVEKLMKDEGIGQEVAFERATTKQVGITVEGLLRTFKVSDEVHTKYVLEDGEKKEVPRKAAETINPDTGLITYEELSNEDRLFKPAVMGNRGDAFFCGDVEGHFIRVGKSHRLSGWDKVDTDDNQSCVKGLHCGGLDYIQGYQGGDTETHNVLVDPMNIGAIPCDDRGAIRVLEYFVADAFTGVNGAIYHSSTYAEQSDKKWDADREEAIKAYGELKDAAESLKDELESL